MSETTTQEFDPERIVSASISVDIVTTRGTLKKRVFGDIRSLESFGAALLEINRGVVGWQKPPEPESTSAAESPSADNRDATTPRHGKWTCSTNEELWNCHEELDTEAEALDYAKFIFCEEQNLEDGNMFWVGQIEEASLADMAGAAAEADRVIERMDEWLYDNIGEASEDTLEATPAQTEDLDKRLTATILAWLREHDIRPRCYAIGKMTSHIFHQCEAVDESQGGPSSTARCVRHEEHEGEHDFP